MTTLTWSAGLGGVYGTATNWTPVQSPDDTDTVLFQVNPSYTSTYTVTGNGAATGVEVEGDNVTTTGTLTVSGTQELNSPHR